MEIGDKIEERKIPKPFLKYLPRRDAYVLKLCEGKRVLHIGASDWPYTKERYERKDLLYARIGEVAKEQLGIDQAKEASEFLNKKKIKSSNIIVGDMNELQVIDFKPDIVIFGETLEHLMNLEVALQNIKKTMQDNTLLIISVPNAFFFMNFIYALFRREHQHPDHSVAFTYKTLTQLLGKNDLIVDDFYFTFLEASSETCQLNWKGKMMHGIVRIMSYISPVYAETLMVVVKKK